MKKKNILKTLSLLAAVCITTCCNGVTAAETTTVALEQSEPEVDYVNENGIIFYKNPVGMTYEMIYEKLKINGVGFEAPLTLEKLGTDFDIDEDSISYVKENSILCAFLESEAERVGVVYLDNSDSDENNRYKEIIHIHSSSSFVMDKTVEFDISFSGISIGTSEEIIINELGIPNSISYNEDKTDALYAYTDDECLVHISCTNGSVNSIYISTYL